MGARVDPFGSIAVDTVGLKADTLPAGGFVHPATGGGPGGLGELVRLFLPGADYDYERQAGDFWRNSAVASCLRVLRANFPEPLLEVRRKSGKGKGSVIPKHPLVTLLENPNPAYDRYCLWASFVTSAVCDGNAYLLKVRSAAGIPVQLWWIPPWMLEPRWATNGSQFIGWYEYYVNGKTFIVHPQDVIHYRHGGLDPRNIRKGMSELKAAGARVVCSLNEVDGFTASILRNMGIPGVVISPKAGALTAEQARIAKMLWRERFTGEGRGEPFFANLGMDVTPIGMTPEQMALNSIPARLEDQASALTGVNAMIAGLSSGALHKTYANMGEAKAGLYDELIIPMQKAVASVLTHQLLDDIGIGDRASQVVGWDYSGIPCLEEDRQALWLMLGVAFQTNKWIKRSEARDLAGLEWDEDDEIYASEASGGENPFGGPAVPPEPGAAEPDDDDLEEPAAKLLRNVADLVTKVHSLIEVADGDAGPWRGDAVGLGDAGGAGDGGGGAGPGGGPVEGSAESG